MALTLPGKLRLYEDHQSVADHAVICHRLGHRLGLHRGHESIHIGNIHQYRRSGRVLRVDEMCIRDSLYTCSIL